MAIITYSQEAVLGTYQQWLMQQGATACLDRITRDQQGPQNPLVGCGPYAQQGTQVRYTVRTTLPSATVFFAGQFQNNVGMWQNVGETVQATSAGGTVQVVRPATQGNYANMVASVGSATVASGEAYAMVELGRTNNGEFIPYAKLVGGYVESNSPIDACSGSHTQNPITTGGGGGTCVCPSTYSIQALDDIESAQGFLVNRTPASGAIERIISMSCSMVAGGTAGNRYLDFEVVVVGAGPVFRQRSASDIAANQDRVFRVFAEIGSQYDEPDVVYGAIPSTLWFSQEYQMQAGIGDFKSGDEMSEAFAIIETRTG